MIDTTQKNSRFLLICFLLTLVTLATFWQVRDHEFIKYDDPLYVAENPQVQAGFTFPGIKWAFTTSQAANWHPLTWLSHMLDCQLFGLNPAWHHLMNLFFHIANTLLLFFVLHRMTKALWQSAFVAALFALHPLHVESVAWVAERKDVLSTFFWMLTMGAYAHYGERPGVRRYLLVLVFFALGLMSKPMLVTIPFVLLLLDYWPLGRFKPADDPTPTPAQKNPGRKKRKAAKDYAKGTTQDRNAGFLPQWPLIYSLIREKVPLFAFAAISSVITYSYQQKEGAMSFSRVLPLDTRMGNALISYVTYVGKMIWPRDLMVLYPYPVMQPVWQILGAALLLVTITILVIGGAKRYPYLVVGWFWFLGTLVPVIGLVQVGMQAMADRYTYVPYIGLFIMIAWGMPDLLKKWPYRKATLAISAGAILIAFMIVTRIQLQYWQDSITLFSHALSVTTNSDTAYIDMGIARLYYNRGVAYGNLGNDQQAMKDFNRAIELDPQYAEAYNNRGVAYGRFGNHQLMIEDFNRGIELNPKYTDAYVNRGTIYGRLGNYQQEIKDYNKAIELDSQLARVYYKRGIAYGNLGNYQQEIKDYNKAIELNPKYADAYVNRGVAYGNLGNEQQAIEDVKIAAKLGDKSAQDYLRSKGIKW